MPDPNRDLPSPSPLARHWGLDADVVQLNHGSFGAAPTVVLERQHELRRRLEADPTGFFLRELPPLADRAREALGAFVGADPECLAFVPNATAAVNTVLRSVDLGPGDEVLLTDHEYPACRNAAEVVCSKRGAGVVVAGIPFPIRSAAEVIERVVEKLSPRTRLLLIDHVTSPSGLVLPVAEIIREAHARAVPVLVDGAHAPGMVELNLEGLGADFSTGNCHKWPCAPKGAAFLWVAEAWRNRVRPLVISHGATEESNRFRREFDWTGTDDPTARLCVPAAIDAIASFVDGGWPEVRRRNHGLALQARDILCSALDVDSPAPDEMVGSMAAVPIPEATEPPAGPFGFDPLQDELFRRYRIEVPVITWLPGPGRVLRVSAQLYNSLEQFEYLADVLGEALST
ncbi:MAG: aminotransferase class V-fold PLP-dependent enzyme [Thermoanaerobaculales bacterium]|jgi:isopenicillin-N epimerase|nr:aminotransferase class V-fold PLP-dependent enzyme [Thermoanaerobaculales bacterium]